MSEDPNFVRTHSSRFVIRLLENRHYLVVFGTILDDDWRKAQFACMLTESNAHKLSQRLFELRPQSPSDRAEKVEVPFDDLAKALWPPGTKIRIGRSSCETLYQMLDRYFQKVAEGNVQPIPKAEIFWFPPEPPS